jgi:hypothetical protein
MWKPGVVLKIVLGNVLCGGGVWYTGWIVLARNNELMVP